MQWYWLYIGIGEIMIVVQQELEWPATWHEADIFAQKLVDRVGCPIDKGILETVVVLNLLGLHTSQSCEGHLDGGRPYPWVDFQTEECPAWYEQAQRDIYRTGQNPEEEEAAIAHLMARVDAFHTPRHLYTRMQALLDTCYIERPDSPAEWRLVIHCVHPGYYRMCPACGYEADEWPANARAGNLARGQAEMRAVTRFLKEYWQNLCKKTTHV